MSFASDIKEELSKINNFKNNLPIKVLYKKLRKLEDLVIISSLLFLSLDIYIITNI